MASNMLAKAKSLSGLKGVRLSSPRVGSRIKPLKGVCNKTSAKVFIRLGKRYR